ncbi:MAG: HAD family hydrolase [Salinirussus sp.]
MSGQYDFWLLDLDGTIVDVDQRYVREVMKQVGAEVGVSFDAAEAHALWYEAEPSRAAVLEAHGIDESTFWRAYRRVENPSARAAATYVYEDAASTLPSLDRPVGVVTHCQPRLVEAVFDRTDIGEWFDAVVCCGEEIGWKPDPAPVERAVGDLGVTGGHGLLVGDALSDVQAAKNAGLEGVLVDRTGTTEAPSTRRIESLTALRA